MNNLSMIRIVNCVGDLLNYCYELAHNNPKNIAHHLRNKVVEREQERFIEWDWEREKEERKAEKSNMWDR